MNGCKRIHSIYCKYGVGLMALKKEPSKVYETSSEAIKAALDCGLHFIVELKGDHKKIIAWDCEVKSKEDLLKQYKQYGDKISALNSKKDDYWLVLITDSGYNEILPLSEVREYEKINIKEYL